MPCKAHTGRAEGHAYLPVRCCTFAQARKEAAKGYGYEDQGVNSDSSDDEIRVSGCARCACVCVWPCLDQPSLNVLALVTTFAKCLDLGLDCKTCSQLSTKI